MIQRGFLSLRPAISRKERLQPGSYTSLALIKFITKYSYKTLHGYLAEHKVKAIKNENDDEQ